MNLFLDDDRNPKDVKWIELPTVEWIIARNYREFIGFVCANGVPQRVSFDHDLADEHYGEYWWCCDPENPNKGNFNYDGFYERTGYDAAKWLCEYCQNNNVKFPEYYAHTMNPIGKENIVSYIENYKRVVENE